MGVWFDAEDEFSRHVVRVLGIVCHGLHGVDHQVQQCLFEQTFIDVHHEWFIGHLCAKANVGLVALGMKEIAEFVDDADKVLWLGIELDAAGELEEIAKYAAEAFDFACE